ncbi:MAG TPA: N-acetylglucosamine-6-phosphate deacetylase [Bacillota bacterium]|nr:N-acetylglucosamine-6-phosphate deacetylase [Bacillota bacterium]
MERGSFAIYNGRVITEKAVIRKGGVLVRDGLIEAVFEGDALPSLASVGRMDLIDADGRFISPGFVDLHVHGGGGSDFMDGTEEAIEDICACHAKGGTTSLLLTTLTSTDDDLKAALGAYKRRVASPEPIKGARPVGVHMEGPYFALSQKGAQDERFLRNPSADHYVPIMEDNPEILRVSAAPELGGAIELGRYLRSRGVLASIGHTDASFEQVELAYEAGYGHMTHLYSAMSGVKRVRGRRIAGAVEAGLAIDGLTVEVIADGMHLPAGLLRLVLKCKGPDRIALVTDAMRAAGLPDGEYLLGSGGEGRKVIVDEGVAWLPDRSAFAGSVALGITLVGNMVRLAGAGVVEAVRMMSLNPARMIGLDGSVGSIAEGKIADLTLFDDGFRVSGTFVAGEAVYRA